LYFMFLYFILWAAVSAAYSALLSSSYFERINDDDVFVQQKFLKKFLRSFCFER